MKIFKPGRSPFRRRPGAVYRIMTRRPGAMTFARTRTGYIGKTRRFVTTRIQQHRACQPWSDLIVSWDVLWESRRVTAFGLWWREIYYILTRFPVYNYQWNRWNPRRVSKYRALIERGKRNGLRRYNGERVWMQ